MLLTVFGFKPKLKDAVFIRQPRTYDNAITFAKRKHHITDNKSKTELKELLQDIRKDVSLKHTGIKQEPYSAPVQDTDNAQRQQSISKLQTDMQFLKESITTPQNQYVTPLCTSLVGL